MSDVSEQAYCEKRVELWLNDPRGSISLPTMLESVVPQGRTMRARGDAGRGFHEVATASSEPVGEKPPRSSRGRPAPYVEFEMPVAGSFAGIRVAGRADAACIEDKRITAVVEYKFTNDTQLQTTHKVQLLSLGYLLQEAGWDVSRLLCACVLVPPANEARIRRAFANRAEEIALTIQATSSALAKSSPSRRYAYDPALSLGRSLSVTLRAFPYTRAKALSELEFFSKFWTGARPAMPTRMPRKCAGCAYNAARLCPDALVPFGRTKAD